KACGTPCPLGQALAADGRCLPNALLAQKRQPERQPGAGLAFSAHKAPPPVERSAPAPGITGGPTTTSAAGVANTPPAEARMAQAGPTDAAAHAADPSKQGTQPSPAAPATKRDAPRRSGFGASFFRDLDRHGNN